MSGAARLLSGRLLAGNVVWSLLGAGLPLVVGVWAIPLLIEGLGHERFGLLTIIWMGIGYFSLFDLGIGRALTKLVAERLANGAEEDLSRLIRLGLRLMASLGVIAALAVAAVAPMFEQLLRVPAALRPESTWSFWILAAALPFVISTAGLIGILQAHQRFRAITMVRIPLGITNFVGPVFVLPFTDSLIVTTVVLAIARALAWFAYYMLCRQYGRPYHRNDSTSNNRTLIRQLLAFGGWITVSNVIGPLMVFFDRLLIGSVLGLVAVTYYTTPYDMVTRLWIFPNAIADVMFPALTTALVANVGQAQRIFVSSALAQVSVMFPAIALLTLFTPELLRIWLDDDFAVKSTDVLHWLALGVYVNCFARIPFALLQSKGRPDITAKLHLIELPVYAVSLWVLMGRWGIEGAAMAWTGRIVVDTILLFLFAARNVPEIAREQHKVMAGVLLTSAVIGWLWLLGSIDQKLLGIVPIACLTLPALFALLRHASVPSAMGTHSG